MTADKKPRRGRGEGTVWLRPDGLWIGQISMGSRGIKRKRKTYYGKTKGQVLDAMTRGKVKHLDGTLPAPSKVTVAQWLEHWLTNVCKRTVAAATEQHYRQIVDLHINPVIGGVKVQKLAPTDVEEVIGTLPADSTRMQQMARDVLSLGLKHAVKMDIIQVNPCDRVARPRHDSPEMQFFSDEEIGDFYKAIRGHRLETLFVLAVGTGARQGELLSLKWTDINFKAETLSIQRTLTYADGAVAVKSPKTKGSRRQIPLDSRSITALRAHEAARMRNGLAGHPWVFCERTGDFLSRRMVTYQFQSLCGRTGLSVMAFHGLRHTHATALLQVANIKVVSERLGHANVGITLRTYAHVLPSMQTDAVAAFNRRFG